MEYIDYTTLGDACDYVGVFIFARANKILLSIYFVHRIWMSNFVAI